VQTSNSAATFRMLPPFASAMRIAISSLGLLDDDGGFEIGC
jgi:hypothetical protein